MSLPANTENIAINNRQTNPHVVDYGSIRLNVSSLVGKDMDGDHEGKNSVSEMENGERHRQRIEFASNEEIASDELCDHRISAALSSCFTVLFSLVIVWYLLYVNLSPYLTAFPGGSVTSLYLLYVAGVAAGWLVEEVANLPPLLGMLVAGIVLQNCGLYVVKASWCIHLLSIMREAALSVILIKGGLGLNPGQLRRLSGSVIKLAILPCVAEALAAAVIAHYTLSNLTWEWALTLGFVLSAVSPAVLVPRLLWLKNRGYGESNGVGTLVIAASSLDDIMSISAFGVLLGLVFSEGNLISKIIQGPVDVCIGAALGIVWGLIMIYMPPSPWANKYKSRGDDEDNKAQTADKLEQATMDKRCFLLGAGGFLAVTGSQLYGYPGAGPLACIISAFVANTGWEWRLKKRFEQIGVPVFEFEQLSKEKNTVEEVFDKFWYALQPILFASIGTEVKFELLQGSDMLLVSLIVLVGGLIVRLVVTSCCVTGTGFDWKEVTFINLAWLPKATVQAALAPVALDRAKIKGTDEDVESATQLLTIAVVSILVTAPIGAIGIQWLGPKLLKRRESMIKQLQIEFRHSRRNTSYNI